jgi:hypothetical protein
MNQRLDIEGRGYLEREGFADTLSVRYRLSVYPGKVLDQRAPSKRGLPSFRGKVRPEDWSTFRAIQLSSGKTTLELEDGQRITIILTDASGSFEGGGQELRIA